MRIKDIKRLPLLLFAGYYLVSSMSVAVAASSTAALQKAKQEAEARGYIFLTSHDDIVSQAKKEGRMKAVSGLESDTCRALQEAFKAEYPFLDVSVLDSTGSESNERMLMELKAGRDSGTDSQKLATDSYANFLPFMKKFDILGMAEQGVLQMSPHFADPVNRNTVALTTVTQTVAYHKKLFSGDKIPDAWDGFLKPEFKGKKFLADIRATEMAALVPAWGLEKTLDFARKLAAQQPIWVRGGTRMLTAMVAGEYALFLGPNMDSVVRVQKQDSSASVVAYKLVEPVQVRIVETTGIIKSSKNPHAALLFFEFATGPKGQKIIDQYEPLTASIFSPYSHVTTATKGKKTSLVGWDHYNKMSGYQAKIVEAYGFPAAEKK